MIQKTFALICDECNRGIDYYLCQTKIDARRMVKKEREVVVYNGKHFCNDNCKFSWKEKHND